MTKGCTIQFFPQVEYILPDLVEHYNSFSCRRSGKNVLYVKTYLCNVNRRCILCCEVDEF